MSGGIASNLSQVPPKIENNHRTKRNLAANPGQSASETSQQGCEGIEKATVTAKGGHFEQ